MSSARTLDILVVDDEITLARAISAALTSRGHDVELAHAADEALCGAAPQVLVVDLHLPGRSGLDLLGAFHARGDRPHTIFVTGDPTVDDCRRALLMGAAEFLSKPFRLDELVSAVERAPHARPSASSDRGVLELSLTSTRAEIARGIVEVLAFALRSGFKPGARARIGTAVSEILDNARRHAYARRAGPIRLRAVLEGSELTITIRDEGVGFDSDHAIRSRRTGLAHVFALCESASIDSAPSAGTRVSLRFTAFRADFGSAAGIDLSELDYLSPSDVRRVLKVVRDPNSSELSGVSPALAVVVGRLLAGPDPLARVEREPWG